MAKRYVRVPDGQMGRLRLPPGARVIEVAKVPRDQERRGAETWVRFAHDSYPELDPVMCHEVPFADLCGPATE